MLRVHSAIDLLETSRICAMLLPNPADCGINLSSHSATRDLFSYTLLTTELGSVQEVGKEEEKNCAIPYLK